MVTGAEAARHIFVSERRFQELLGAGVIERKGRAGYDLNAVREAYIGHLREVAAGRMSADGEGLDLTAERARLAKEQADKLEMENAASRGELLPRGDVVSALQAVFARCRARLLSLPTKLAPLIVGEQSPAVVQDRITAGVHEALEELRGLKLVAISED